MTKRIMSLMLIGFLLNFAFYSTVKANDDKKAAEFNQKVNKIGVGEKAKIRVKTKDGREFNGYVKEITDDYFTVVSELTGSDIKIQYSQVKKIIRPTSRRSAILYTIVFFVVWGLLGSQSDGV
jgi:cytochrome oxidase Cu insertion factor (SCO1/SenC/PrrC family)